MTIIVIYKFEMRNIKIFIYDYGGIHTLVRYYVDLSDLYVVLSDLYVDLSDLYVDLSLIHLLENES